MKKNSKPSLPVRKKGRPKKTKEVEDYRLQPVRDPRLKAMKESLDQLPLGSTQYEAARKEYFAALLDHKLGVEERADLIVALARKDDAKSAPVALRALQDINIATRVTDQGAAGAPSIFVLPVGTSVAVKPQIVEAEGVRLLDKGED